MDMLTSTARGRGRALSIYADERTLELLEPWTAGRQRSARLAAIIGRYDTLTASRVPELDLHQWNVVLHLLPPLASLRDACRLWAEVADRHRDQQPLPNVDGEQLASRLRAMAVPELLGLLEVVDRAAMADGSVPERLAAAGVRLRR